MFCGLWLTFADTMSLWAILTLEETVLELGSPTLKWLLQERIDGLSPVCA